VFYSLRPQKDACDRPTGWGQKEPKLGHGPARPLSGASIRRARAQQGGQLKGRRPPSLESPAPVPIRKLEIE